MVTALNVFPLRSDFLERTSEHHSLQDRIDEGEDEPRTERGAGLSEAFEYRANAAESYLWSLESALIIGVFPAILIMFGALFAAVSERKEYPVRNHDTTEDKP